MSPGHDLSNGSEDRGREEGEYDGDGGDTEILTKEEVAAVVEMMEEEEIMADIVEEVKQA